MCLISIILLFTCSDDSNPNNDIIIGKWKIIEMYDNEILVDIPFCVPFYYYEYKSDHSINGGTIANTPDNCQVITFDFGWTWENLGNNRYLKHLANDNHLELIVYKNGVHLIIEESNNTKTIYEPY